MGSPRQLLEARSTEDARFLGMGLLVLRYTSFYSQV